MLAVVAETLILTRLAVGLVLAAVEVLLLAVVLVLVTL
jgi:hypothetical protein